ncbi:MAG: hypothetical protein KVP17_000027 [Porospora cf. gigantea B]|uniref:uncharacterized protein n=1 Tax=Porospora cf. gigantea B TaxID=2853592 RepID=UPI003571E6CD|nr:MAG: hypothetical protein KVP17_000027 [Porospora cf. gigantea B]
MNSRRGSLRRSCMVVHAELPEFLASITELFLTLGLGVGSLIGSLYFVFDQPVHGCLCFAFANTVGSAAVFYLVARNWETGDLSGGYCALNLLLGSLVFAVCSFTYLHPPLEDASAVGFFVGSFFFLLASLETLRKNGIGPFTAVRPWGVAWIPSGLTFFISAVAYIAGSGAFLKGYLVEGSLAYLVGSILSVVLAWCDIVNWIEAMSGVKTE